MMRLPGGRWITGEVAGMFSATILALS